MTSRAKSVRLSIKMGVMRCTLHKVVSGGFTLIELLVVISIIALLLSILMPSLRRAKEQAAKVICKTQLKDLGVVFNLYTIDNNDKLPSSAASPSETVGYSSQRAADSEYRWYCRINRYYDKKSRQDAYDYSLYKCVTQKKWLTKGGSGIYGYNQFFFYPKDYSSSSFMDLRWRRVQDIMMPSEFPLLADLSAEDPLNLLNKPETERGGVILHAQNPHPLSYKYAWMGGEWATSRHDYWGPAPNHGNGASNFLFGDGHAESRNVCKAGRWPWLGDDKYSQTSGKAFHPKRNVSISP